MTGGKEAAGSDLSKVAMAADGDVVEVRGNGERDARSATSTTSTRASTVSQCNGLSEPLESRRTG